MVNKLLYFSKKIPINVSLVIMNINVSINEYLWIGIFFSKQDFLSIIAIQNKSIGIRASLVNGLSKFYKVGVSYQTKTFKV